MKVGQRVRAFPPSSQVLDVPGVRHARDAEAGGRRGRSDARASGRANTTLYVMEIVVERGRSCRFRTRRSSKKATGSIVYVQQDGEYVPQEIHTGIQGELYTQVLEGLQANDAGRHLRQLLHRRRAQAEGRGLDQ